MTIVADSTVYPGRRFKGTVTSIDSRVDPVTRAVTVIATVPNGDGLLKPGMFLTVAWRRSATDVLMIPEEALVPAGGPAVRLHRAGRQGRGARSGARGPRPGPGGDPQRPRRRGTGRSPKASSALRDGVPVQVPPDS